MHTLIINAIIVHAGTVTHKVDRVSVDVGEGDASTNGITEHSTDNQPGGKLEGLRYHFPIQLKVAQVTFTTKETQRDVTGLQMFCEPRGRV